MKLFGVAACADGTSDLGKLCNMTGPECTGRACRALDALWYPSGRAASSLAIRRGLPYHAGNHWHPSNRCRRRREHTSGQCGHTLARPVTGLPPGQDCRLSINLRPAKGISITPSLLLRNKPPRQVQHIRNAHRHEVLNGKVGGTRGSDRWDWQSRG